ncbi:MAG: LCP family protein [bacterium]|nr:LCP family protein [bacterium]
MHRPIKVNFLNADSDKSAKRTVVTITAVFCLVVGSLSAIGAGASYRSATYGTSVFGELKNLPVISDIRRLVLGSEVNAEPAITESSDQINFMLFGVGGEGHAGSQLTDTIILASLDTKDNRVSMLSIPRDLAYPLGNAQFQKINAVNAYAEESNPGEGAQIASQAIGKLLGIPINHVIKVDFGGFVKFIDALGGLDITVERSFTDLSYPTWDDKWQTVQFNEGKQHMDGDFALKYVRSRHGNNSEGTDFARSRRQQIVLTAVRQKLLSLGTLANPNRIAQLWGIVSSHIQTDLTPWEIVKLAQSSRGIDQTSIQMRVLTDEPNGELTPGNINGAYMLFPKKPDWSEIREIASNPFETKEDRIVKYQSTQEIQIELKNGTHRSGFASSVQSELEKHGFTVGAVGNATQRGYEETVIYDLTNGQKSEDLVRLKQLLKATVSTADVLTDDKGSLSVYTKGLVEEEIASKDTDFIIILGDSSLGLIEL